MLELFIELTDQLFWEGYAEQQAQEQPLLYRYELAEFIQSFNT